MKTMQEAWREYKDKVYPEPIGEVQHRETHQAFFAGALSVIGLMSDAAKVEPDEQAAKELERLKDEVVLVCSYKIKTTQERN